MSTAVLYLLLLKATALSFSGFASVPLVREDFIVKRGVLTDEQLNTAIAIGQASPGPLGLYIVIVGYFVGGAAGAVAGIVAISSPALLAIPIAGAVRRGRTAALGGLCAGIVIASCVLMALTALQLLPEAAPNVKYLLLAAAGLAALATGRVAPLFVIVLSAGLGALLQ